MDTISTWFPVVAAIAAFFFLALSVVENNGLPITEDSRQAKLTRSIALLIAIFCVVFVLMDIAAKLAEIIQKLPQ